MPAVALKKRGENKDADAAQTIAYEKELKSLAQKLGTGPSPLVVQSCRR